MKINIMYVHWACAVRFVGELRAAEAADNFAYSVMYTPNVSLYLQFRII